MFKALLGRAHATLIFARRTRIVSAAICNLLPRDAGILDVGSADGTIAYPWIERRSDLTAKMAIGLKCNS
jgi:hypothetical protein